MDMKRTIQHLGAMHPVPIHNFSLGCLDAYFYLTEDLQSGQTRVMGSKDQILVMSRRKKVYVLQTSGITRTDLYKVDGGAAADLEMLQKLQSNCVIYAPSPISLPREGKFSEVTYTVSKILDPASYPDKKKRYNRLTYPLKWMRDNQVRVLTEPINEKEVEALHDQWVEHKLADPTTYQIMFPRKRYIRCVERLLQHPTDINYRGFFFYLGDKLCSVRIISIENEWGYDLANFSRFWDTPSQFSNYCDAYVLIEELKKLGVQRFNCGAALNKNLKLFKSHYPFDLAVSYMYSKVGGTKTEESKEPPRPQQRAFF